MSREWARVRARENEARLRSAVEREAGAKIVQHPIGPIVCLRPSGAQPVRPIADTPLSDAPGGPSQSMRRAHGAAEALPEPLAAKPQGRVPAVAPPGRARCH
jgi:hypothetical protein